MFPSGLTTIGFKAFSDCACIENIQLPYTVTSIGSRAFFRCNSLQSITISGRVTEIGKNAFDKCPSLTSIYIKATDEAEFIRVRNLLPAALREKVRRMPDYECVVHIHEEALAALHHLGDSQPILAVRKHADHVFFGENKTPDDVTTISEKVVGNSLVSEAKALLHSGLYPRVYLIVPA